MSSHRVHDDPLIVERVELDDPRLREIVSDELRRRLQGVPDDMAAPLVVGQVASKMRSLVDTHPGAVVQLLSVDASPVGYCVTATSAGVVRLCDIAVIGSARGSGFGSRLLDGLLDACDLDGSVVTLSVWSDAPARSWYERRGFVVSGSDGDGYVEMRREPEPRE